MRPRRRLARLLGTALVAWLVLVASSLSAAEGLRVVIISDLNGRYGSTDYAKEVTRAVERIAELQPDLVISTGDMVAGQRRPHLSRTEVEAMWSAFHMRVSEPLEAAGIPFAVTPGNHDASAYSGFALERAIYAQQWSGRHSAVRFIDDGAYPFHYAFVLDGTDLGALDESQLRGVRGNRISMIFQEPMSALNPVYTVGAQIAEALLLHKPVDKASAREQAIELLASVGIPDPVARSRNYPHELSGGMRQRVLIAMALACEPDLIIADEPTTALDVTIQAQILDLLHDLQERLGTAILFISHDFGVVSQMADDIAVMYAGRIIEQGSASDVLNSPVHPYTRALLATTPRLDQSIQRLPAIAGRVPGPFERDAGCHFRSRCSEAEASCEVSFPELIASAPGHLCACHVVNARG